MAYFTRYLIALLAVALSPLVTFAQSAPADNLSVKFTVFARYRQAGLQYFPSTEAKPVSLQFFAQSRSPVYNYKGAGKVSFYEEAALAKYIAAKAVDPRTAMPAPVAVAAIPTGVKQAMLLFLPVPTPQADGIKFVVYAVDDGLERLPSGNIAVINASGNEYMGQLGEKVVSIPKGRSDNVPASGTVELKLAYNDAGRWVPAANHLVSLGSRGRVCVVLFPASSKTGIAPIIRALAEDLPVTKGGQLVTQSN